MSHTLLGMHNIRSVVIITQRLPLPTNCQVLQVKITDSLGQEFNLNLFNPETEDIAITLPPTSEIP